MLICPHCRRAVEVTGPLAGRILSCPHCRGAFSAVAPPLPGPATAEPFDFTESAAGGGGTARRPRPPVAGPVLIALSAGSYVVALFLPAVAPLRDSRPGPGWMAFVSCLLALLSPWEWRRDDGTAVMAASWLANPAIWAGWCLAAAGHGRRAACAGAGGVALGLTALIGFRAEVVGQPGYWLWVASAAVLLAAGKACRTR